MSIEKKSLISTLKSAKKANVAKEEVSMDHVSRGATKSQPSLKLSKKLTPTIKLSKKLTPTIKLSKKLAPTIKLSQKFD